jgi:molybdopterin converting factor small subunit
MPVDITIEVKYVTEVKEQIGREQEEFKIKEGGRIVDLWEKILERHTSEIESAGYVDPKTREPYIYDPGAPRPSSLMFFFQRKGMPGCRMIWWHDGLQTELIHGDVVFMAPPTAGCGG